MLSWSANATVTAAASYEGALPGFTHRYDCTAECAGHPLVELKVCAPASSFASRVTYHAGIQTHTVDFPASGAAACRTINVRLADGAKVSAEWQYHPPWGWTRSGAAPGAFTVDCPGVPPVAVLLSYDCTAASLTAVLGTSNGTQLVALKNTTTHRMVLVIEGGRALREELAPGATAAPHTLSLQCGAHTKLSVRAGIQRANGQYNYGPATELTSP
jgi:hypothetical protein